MRGERRRELAGVHVARRARGAFRVRSSASRDEWEMSRVSIRDAQLVQMRWSGDPVDATRCSSPVRLCDVECCRPLGSCLSPLPR